MAGIAIAALAATTISAPVQAAQPGRLSGETIKELISGATVHMQTPVGTVLPVKYAENGTVTGRTSGMVAYYLGASKDRGKWWIEGRQLCQQWKIWFSGKRKCIEIRRQGQKYHWKDRDGKTGVATIAGRPRTTVAAKKATSRKLQKPYSLGVATEAHAALPEVSQPITTARTIPARAARKPHRKVSKVRTTTTRPRRTATFRTPPPLPVRRTQLQRYVKTSSWTMRSH